MRAVNIPGHIQDHLSIDASNLVYVEAVRNKVVALQKGPPEVSVVIPAYNEEKTLLKTLSSLAATSTNRSVEIIVVDNNSVDKTGEIATKAGATYVYESEQGYMQARNAGLKAAKGKYILNADADSIYPPYWIDAMIDPMEKKEGVILVYGRFSFYSSTDRKRWKYYFYEIARDISAICTKRIKDEAMFVMGANSGFLRDYALKVDGFSHPPGANEDGYLALKLRKYGRIHYVRKSIIWTSDRRLVEEGSLTKSFHIRLRRFLRRLCTRLKTGSSSRGARNLK